jgi:hypothetical protein
VREINAQPFYLALVVNDQSSQLGPLLAERIDGNLGHPDIVGWPLARLNADVVALAT